MYDFEAYVRLFVAQRAETQCRTREFGLHKLGRLHPPEITALNSTVTGSGNQTALASVLSNTGQNLKSTEGRMGVLKVQRLQTVATEPGKGFWRPFAE